MELVSARQGLQPGNLEFRCHRKLRRMLDIAGGRVADGSLKLHALSVNVLRLSRGQLA